MDVLSMGLRRAAQELEAVLQDWREAGDGDLYGRLLAWAGHRPAGGNGRQSGVWASAALAGQVCFARRQPAGSPRIF